MNLYSMLLAMTLLFSATAKMSCEKYSRLHKSTKMSCGSINFPCQFDEERDD